MKRSLLWIGVMFLIGILEMLVYERHAVRQPNEVLLFFLALTSVIWFCVGVAWGARGVVRYLRR